MSPRPSNRNIPLAAIAAAIGLVWLTAPALACDPTMRGNNNSSGSSNNNNNNGNNNGSGEQQRQSVSDAAGDGLDNSNGGASRGSGGNQNVDNSNQITAATQGQAASDADTCRKLRAQLAELTGDKAPDPYKALKSLQIYWNRVNQMTPAMLDAEIARTKSDEDNETNYENNSRQVVDSILRSIPGGGPAPSQPPVDRRYSAKVSFLMDLRAAKGLGYGVDDVSNRMASALSSAAKDADTAAADQRTQIRDLQSQMADLHCAELVPTANTSPSSNSSPSDSASPADNANQ